MEKVRFGTEKRFVIPDPEITEGDLISQAEARTLLGIADSTLIQGMDRGRYTVVWDLEHDGTGRKSARMLLRSEIEAMARGELRRKPVRRQSAPPIISPP